MEKLATTVLSPRLIIFLPISLYLIVATYFIYHRTALTPDQSFLILFIFAIFFHKGREFLKDWSIPIGLIIFYDFLRGFISNLDRLPHINPMVTFSRKLFGSTLSGRWQKALFTQGHFHWYDYLTDFAYMIHFITPMFVGYLLWVSDKKAFKQFFYSLVLLSYMALITFLVFPSAPPWYAAAYGYISHNIHLGDLISATLPKTIYLPTIYYFVPANIFAAVPSLHIGYAWVVSLIAIRKSKKFIPLVLFYVLLEIFSVIYLAEHYILDAFLGLIYASVAYYLIELLLSSKPNFVRKLVKSTKNRLTLVISRI